MCGGGEEVGGGGGGGVGECDVDRGGSEGAGTK